MNDLKLGWAPWYMEPSMLVMGRKAQIQHLRLQGSPLSLKTRSLAIRRLLVLPQADGLYYVGIALVFPGNSL